MSIKQISERETALENENARLWQELFSARETVESLKTDAERYRWIVGNIVEDTMEAIEDAFAVFGDALGCTKAEFDAAIDAAMKGKS